jgi:hypothetical protein
MLHVNKILITILLLNFASSFSQNLSLSELANLRSLDTTSATKDLESKNWKKIRNKEPIYNYGDILFIYNEKATDQETQKLVSFYYSTQADYPNRIHLQVDKNGYDFYKSQLESLDFKFITSATEEEMNIEIYQNKTITVKISQPIDKNNSNLFYFFILDNSDYFKNIHERINSFKKP